ncbi:MAG: hypothetical protein J7501_18445, partial [Bdellovibrio sp.]|nr:hypothetical protein [Bdellovibrio sp.]
MKNTEPNLYFGNWLFSSVVEDDALTRSYKYRLLVSITILTGLLMWTYTLVAAFFISGLEACVVGFVCSTVHALSPVIYRKTHSMVLA